MSSDLNNDGVISIKDINMLLSDWDTTNTKQTILDEMLSSYNEPSPQPEPESEPEPELEVDTSLFNIISEWTQLGQDIYLISY